MGLPSVNGELANSAVASGWSARPTRNFFTMSASDRIVEIDLDGAGAQHHVEAEGADARHVVEHDLVAALGHDRQLGAGLVGPHAEAEEAEAELRSPTALHLLQVAAGLGAGLVEILERRARKLELAGGLQADRAVGAGRAR